MAEWYGEIKPHKPIVKVLNKAENGSSARHDLTRLLESDANFPIAQFAVLSRLIEERFRPNMDMQGDTIVEILERLSKSRDIEISALALMSLHLTRDQDDEIHNFLTERLANLGSNEMAVRRRWSVALAYLGQRYRSRGEAGNAIAAFGKALEILPDDPATLQNLGFAYQDAGDMNSAFSAFTKAVEVDPYNAMAYINLGLAYAKKGDGINAKIAYQKAFDVNPHNSIAHFNLGNAAYRNDSLEEAIEHYERAVEIDPALSPCYFSLARAYIKKKEFEKAREAVKGGLFYDRHNQSGQAMLQDLNSHLGFGEQ